MPTPTYNGVFNVTEGVDGTGHVCFPGQAPGPNTASLQYMISKLLSIDGPTGGQGGTLQFPSAGPSTAGGADYQPYQFNGTITIGPDDEDPPVTQPWSIILEGTGQGEINVPLLQQTASEDLFVVQTVTSVGSADIGGVVFRDLMIGYTEGASGQNAAIHVEGIVNGGASQNVRVVRVALIDCPIGVWFENSFKCSMIDCTVYNGSNSGTGLKIGSFDSPATLQSAIETYVAGCLFECAGGAIGTGTAVEIYGCEHLRMVNTRLDSYGQGIVITAGAQSGNTAANVRKLYFGNVSAYPSNAGAALVIQSGSSKAALTEAFFTHCEFAPAGSTTSYTGAGIVIQPGSTGPINQIRFVDCYCCFWTGPGMLIAGGTNIEILGGTYSCNGTASGSEPYSQSGIAIVGPATGIRITGVACNNSAYNLDATPPGFASPTQVYGIYVSGASDSGPTSVRVTACDLTGGATGNTESGLYVTGASGTPTNVFVKSCDISGYTSTPAVQVVTPVSNVQITDCSGYNDQGTVVSTTTPVGVFYGHTLGYYGPITFAVWGGAIMSIVLSGHSTNLTAGNYYLGCNESAAIVSTAVPNFLAIGV